MNFWNELPHPFTVLAPMEGVTDIVFRQVVAKAGRPDVFFTEFTNVSSFASEKGRHDVLERLDIAENEPPIVAQIWGKNPEHFAETASALKNLGFSGLDINMGCPDKHVNKAGGGAAMIKTPELALECLKQAKANTTLPVSVKTRLGWARVEEYSDWLSLLLGRHLAALTVHLRTKKEMSKVSAHYELIPEIVKLRNQLSPETKLIINGDIAGLLPTEKSEQVETTAPAVPHTSAKELHEKYPEVDGFMIGRGVFQNPYCFTEHQPTREELTDLFLYHLNLFDVRQKDLESRGSRYPYEPLKHFFKIYVNGYNGSKDLRMKLMSCTSTSELRQILRSAQ